MTDSEKIEEFMKLQSGWNKRTDEDIKKLLRVILILTERTQFLENQNLEARRASAT